MGHLFARAHIPRLFALEGRVFLFLLCTGFWLFPLGEAFAAAKKELVKPGELLIDGFRVKCGTTPVLISEDYPDFGAARRGLIILNPQKLKKLSRGAKLLIYYHECAHQYVGGSELAADCWAVQKVRREGVMNRAQLLDACTFVKSLPANRRHPPGNVRCSHMMQCYRNTFRKDAHINKVHDATVGRGAFTSRGFSKPGLTVEPVVPVAPVGSALDKK